MRTAKSGCLFWDDVTIVRIEVFKSTATKRNSSAEFFDWVSLPENRWALNEGFENQATIRGRKKPSLHLGDAMALENALVCNRRLGSFAIAASGSGLGLLGIRLLRGSGLLRSRCLGYRRLGNTRLGRGGLETLWSCGLRGSRFLRHFCFLSKLDDFSRR